MADISVVTYYPTILIVSMIMVIVVVLTYMLSKVFRVTELEAYMGIELTEIFNSMILMFFAISFFLVSDAVAVSLTQEYYAPAAAAAATGAQPITAIAAARAIIQNTVLDVQEGMNDVFSLQVCLSILNVLSRRMGEAVLTVSYKLFPGIDSIIGVTNVVSYSLVSVLSSLTAQLFMLDTIKILAPNFLLPAGIVLRFLPTTREAGVFLIALSIGMYSVFPLMFVIDNAILNDLAKAGFEDFKGFKSPGALVPAMCGGQYSLAGASLWGASQFIPNSVVTSAMRLVFSEYSVNLFTMSIFMPVLTSTAYLSLPALFLPALATSISFAFINALTKFLLLRAT